jgi:hypothetical protein
MLEPPAPDVRVTYSDRPTEVFEVTVIHPDETPGGGSEARRQEMLRARGSTNAIVPSWVAAQAVPAIRRRVEQKANKSAGYLVAPGETLSLLLVGSLPQVGALASTFIFAPFVTLEQLNSQLSENLLRSRFQAAYLHLPLSGNAAWGWARQSGWTVLCAPEDSAQEGRQTLDALRGLGAGGLLPGTQVFGWPR